MGWFDVFSNVLSLLLECIGVNVGLFVVVVLVDVVLLDVIVCVVSMVSGLMGLVEFVVRFMSSVVV